MSAGLPKKDDPAREHGAAALPSVTAELRTELLGVLLRAFFVATALVAAARILLLERLGLLGLHLSSSYRIAGAGSGPDRPGLYASSSNHTAVSW